MPDSMGSMYVSVARRCRRRRLVTVQNVDHGSHRHWGSGMDRGTVAVTAAAAAAPAAAVVAAAPAS